MAAFLLIQLNLIPKRYKIMKYILLSAFSITGSILFSQEINQFDTNGKRHGIWKKYYDGTKVLRYEGAFNHGKEIDTFKFYKNVDSVAKLSAIRVFNKDSKYAQVKFYTSKGKLMSEGKMLGKLYVGEWLFYHSKNDKIMTREHYNEQGELHGEVIVYYANGNIAEIKKYEKGKLHGKTKLYSEKNELISEYTYVDDKLHGEAKIYEPSGNIAAEGIYRNNKRHGIWKFYEKGKLIEEKDFTIRSKNPYTKKKQ